jgi:ABC-type transport system substrate-binding protein
MKNLKLVSLVAVLVIASLVLAACPQPEPQVVEKVVTQVVEVEKIVEQTVVTEVEKIVEQTVVVEEQVEVATEDYTTPHPILSDPKVRQAIAHCIDRDALIESVYPYVEDKTALRMDSWLPQSHWAYSGPYDFPDYDPEAGAALLDEAGWTLAEGATVRTNAAGDSLAVKYATTNAQFRQTWSAVMLQNLAACGIQALPSFVPASWWFGDTTGLSRRDFELGAFAWVGQPDPSGVSTYACSQIPLPSNNWEGQNYMGWCNETANAAVIRANNTLIKDERIAAYDEHQKEFAKDVVSIPMFERAEVEAWRTALQGVKSNPTEYATASLHEWTLADGGDTIVHGMTQEPDSMWHIATSMAAQREVAVPGTGYVPYTQYDYDFQPDLQDPLSTIENDLATNTAVEVKAGDKVYSAAGEPVELAAGVTVIDSEGNEVEYDGSSPLMMNQLVVTYKLKPFTWSDGTPATVADMALGVKIDCDPESGNTTFDLCKRIGDLENDITYSDSELAMTITYLPGNQYPLYYLYPFSYYPSQRVLSDGRVLADVPAVEWLTLPEIAETPLSAGAYYITEWVKGQSITLAANPYWWGGQPATPNVIFVFLADTNQAVAQLINGDVDFLDDSTLGAGAEVQTVIDAAETTGDITYRLAGGGTWEHIDINLFTK